MELLKLVDIQDDAPAIWNRLHDEYGSIVEFYGFSEVSDSEKQNYIVSAPEYMLVKIIHDIGRVIQLPGLPPSIVPLKKNKIHPWTTPTSTCHI